LRTTKAEVVDAPNQTNNEEVDTTPSKNKDGEVADACNNAKFNVVATPSLATPTLADNITPPIRKTTLTYPRHMQDRMAPIPPQQRYKIRL